ncbi:MAG: hypothetical protein M1833_002179 [Piccolia ochrophora]|nr:MAG: hypothetical protein M1833_002179 [Piccolia ochrophora]
MNSVLAGPVSEYDKASPKVSAIAAVAKLNHDVLYLVFTHIGPPPVVPANCSSHPLFHSSFLRSIRLNVNEHNEQPNDTLIKSLYHTLLTCPNVRVFHFLSSRYATDYRRISCPYHFEFREGDRFPPLQELVLDGLSIDSTVSQVNDGDYPEYHPLYIDPIYEWRRAMDFSHLRRLVVRSPCEARFFKQLIGCVPNLRALEFNLHATFPYSNQRHAAHRVFSSFIAGLHDLEELSLIGFGHKDPLPLEAMSLHAATLQALEIHKVSASADLWIGPQGWQAIAEACPNLTHLTIDHVELRRLRHPYGLLAVLLPTVTHLHVKLRLSPPKHIWHAHLSSEDIESEAHALITDWSDAHRDRNAVPAHLRSLRVSAFQRWSPHEEFPMAVGTTWMERRRELFECRVVGDGEVEGMDVSEGRVWVPGEGEKWGLGEGESMVVVRRPEDGVWETWEGVREVRRLEAERERDRGGDEEARQGGWLNGVVGWVRRGLGGEKRKREWRGGFYARPYEPVGAPL